MDCNEMGKIYGQSVRDRISENIDTNGNVCMAKAVLDAWNLDAPIRWYVQFLPYSICD